MAAPLRGASGTGITMVSAGRCDLAARTARTSASGRVTISAGPPTRGSTSRRAFSWSGVVAQLTDVTLVQGPPGRVSEHVFPAVPVPAKTRAADDSAASASSARTSSGRRRSWRNGPCAGSRSVVTGPASRTMPSDRRPRQPFGDRQHGQRGALLVLQYQAARIGRDHAGGYVEGHRHRPGRAVGQHAAFGDRGPSAASMKPCRGANTPDVSSSRSPSCASPSVHTGQSGSSAGRAGGD